MTKKQEHPVRTPNERTIGGDRETHPAYGQLSFSRVQGNPGVLYGSHLDRHMGFVRMKLHRSTRHHHLSYDSHLADGPVVEVDLSYTQFAELITTMNVGSGVPCTIRALPGEELPEIAHHETEQKRVKEEFATRIRGFADTANERMKALDAVLGKPSIGKADRDSIRSQFTDWVKLIQSSAPFVLDQFQESVEKTAAAAKAEVEGFITSAVASAGLGAIRDRLTAEPEPPSLPGKE